MLWLMRLSTSSSRSKRSAVRPRRWPPCSCCSGYQALSSEAPVGAGEGEAAWQALLQHNPVLASTRAARDARLLALDPTLQVGGLGSRVPDGLAMLAAGFYPASQPQTAEAQRQP